MLLVLVERRRCYVQAPSCCIFLVRPARYPCQPLACAASLTPLHLPPPRGSLANLPLAGPPQANRPLRASHHEAPDVGMPGERKAAVVGRRELTLYAHPFPRCQSRPSGLPRTANRPLLTAPAFVQGTDGWRTRRAGARRSRDTHSRGKPADAASGAAGGRGRWPDRPRCYVRCVSPSQSLAAPPMHI